MTAFEKTNANNNIKTALAGQASLLVPRRKNQTNTKGENMFQITKTDLQLAQAALIHLEKFIAPQQLECIRELMTGEEGQFFIDKVLELSTIVQTMPVTYETDGQGKNAVAYLHYFSRDVDWYIVERDVEEEQHQAFGLVKMWELENGYISIVELMENNVELDLHWTPKTIEEVAKSFA